MAWLLLLVPVLLAILLPVLWRGRAERGGAWWILLLLVALALAGAGWLVAADLVAQKLVGRLLMPVGLLWLACWLAAVVAWRRAGLRAALPWLAAVLLFGLAGNQWLGSWMMQRLEAAVPADDGRSFEAVWVLGGGSDTSADGPQLGYNGDRLRRAAALYHAGRAPLLLCSGSAIAGYSGGEARDLGAESRELLVQMGVPAAAVLTLPGPRTTAEEAAAVARLVRERGWRRVGALSSAWHLPRALRLAERQGLVVQPLAADRRGAIPAFAAPWAVPWGEGFFTLHIAAWELLGRTVGR